jgi:hypothetical protein
MRGRGESPHSPHSQVEPGNAHPEAEPPRRQSRQIFHFQVEPGNERTRERENERMLTRRQSLPGGRAARSFISR